MPNASLRSESPSGVSGGVPLPPGTGERPGPYESPRRVLRGYDQPPPAPMPGRNERDAAVRARDERR